jgi:hypothetical protein
MELLPYLCLLSNLDLGKNGRENKERGKRRRGEGIKIILDLLCTSPY